MTFVQLTDKSRVHGHNDTLDGAGSEMGFEVHEEVSSMTRSLFQMKKKDAKISLKSWRSSYNCL